MRECGWLCGFDRNLLCVPLALALLLALAASAQSGEADGVVLEPAPPDLDAREVALRAENSMRGDRTFMRAAMTVRSPRLSKPRVVEFESWDDRPGKRSFIRIHAPAKDAGAAFLKLHPNLWSYVPRVERTLRIPPSMMMQSWMGSDFTNDDLVRESSTIDDYDHEVLGIDPSPVDGDAMRAYVVEFTPHEEAPVVWGKILAWIEIEHGTQLRQDFYDEDGELMRTMRFRDIRELQGRWVPHVWDVVPLDKEGHSTRIEIFEFRFDKDFDESIFTTGNLKKRK